VAYGVLRELRRQGNLIEGDTVMVEVHPDVAQILAGPDHIYMEEIEKRLQKRIIVKARSSYELEDYELHSPGQKAIEHSENGSDRNEPRRHRRRKKVGSPAEVQAILDEEEQASLRSSVGTGEPSDDGEESQTPTEDADAPGLGDGSSGLATSGMPEPFTVDTTVPPSPPPGLPDGPGLASTPASAAQDSVSAPKTED
jgi:hypothetical protein